MTPIHESDGMREIRIIRDELSQELKKLSPAERAALIRERAERIEKEFGLNLPRAAEETVKSR
jgi:hypothetical protein